MMYSQISGTRDPLWKVRDDLTNFPHLQFLFPLKCIQGPAGDQFPIQRQSQEHLTYHCITWDFVKEPRAPSSCHSAVAGRQSAALGSLSSRYIGL